LCFHLPKFFITAASWETNFDSSVLSEKCNSISEKEMMVDPDMCRSLIYLIETDDNKHPRRETLGVREALEYLDIKNE